MIRVAVVDDHPHVAIALRALLDKSPDIRLVAESKQGRDVATLVRRSQLDVLLLDLLIEPEFDALATVRGLRMDFPDLKICLLSAFLEPSLVYDFLQAGVHGYILKDDDYVSRIDVIIRGKYNRYRKGRLKSCDWQNVACPIPRLLSRYTFRRVQCEII
jgi:NarL family two-component system response regulator LiaR